MDALKVLYVLFHLGRGSGRVLLETHVESPYDSEIFQAHPSVLADYEATRFICDSFRMAISAGLNGQEERLMVVDRPTIEPLIPADPSDSRKACLVKYTSQITLICVP